MRTKRTYNLSADVVATVKRLVETERAAPTQDALVEAAILHYARLLRDREDERSWAAAASDEEFRSEQARIWRDFRRDDRSAFDS